MKYYVVSDYRENFKNYSLSNQTQYNDHPSKRNIDEIITSINKLGYHCEYFGGIPELIRAVDQERKFNNCIFLNFSDGMEQNYSRVQAPALLDILNVPYSGSDVFPSVIMNNKHYCKQILKDEGIQTAKSIIVNAVLPLKRKVLFSLNFPLFVKPNCEGSSLGISQKSVCHTIDEVQKRVEELLKEFSEIIIEEYIPGIDITNYLIGNNKKYYINDIITAELFDKSSYAVYDNNIKQNKLRKLYYNEEKIPTDIIRQIQTQSIRIAEIIGAKDICRIDYRLDFKTNKLVFIEINSAPRFSSTSEIGFIANKRNITFTDLLDFYISSVNNRYNFI